MEPHHSEPPFPLAVALSFFVGVGVAVQAFCNGRLAKELGSIEVAGLAAWSPPGCCSWRWPWPAALWGGLCATCARASGSHSSMFVGGFSAR